MKVVRSVRITRFCCFAWIEDVRFATQRPVTTGIKLESIGTTNRRSEARFAVIEEITGNERLATIITFQSAQEEKERKKERKERKEEWAQRKEREDRKEKREK
jgi:hypothetical protein